MSDELEDRGPGANFEVFIENEKLMERLKLLGYETKFVQKGLRPISKITFSIQNKENQGSYFRYYLLSISYYTLSIYSIGEQFTQFTKLSQFLLSQNGINLEIDEFDDPGQIISQIVEHCRRLGKVDVDFPPQKLRPGYGPFVVALLSDLAGLALSKSFRFHSPSYPEERDEPEQAIEESDPEIDMEDDIDADYSDDAENDILQLNDDIEVYHDIPKVKQLPKVDPEAWQEEVDRLAPQLKVISYIFIYFTIL